MFMSTPLLGEVADPVLVQLPGISLGNTREGVCYSGIRFDNDGNIYKMDAAGNWQYAAAWLLSGAAGDYYLHRTINYGTLNTDDGTAVQMNTADIDYWLSYGVPWDGDTASITFEIADDASKTTVYATRTYFLSAFSEGTGVPP